MKQLLKSAKSICALVLAMVLLMSMSTVAFAADNTIDTEEDISSVLARINAEYGTNIRELSESELIQYGLTAAEPQAAKSCEPVDLEETLHYIVEVQIPQFERTTQEANAVKAMLFDEVSKFGTTAGTVVARKAIDYATAAVEAYITNDSYWKYSMGYHSEIILHSQSKSVNFFYPIHDISNAHGWQKNDLLDR